MYTNFTISPSCLQTIVDVLHLTAIKKATFMNYQNSACAFLYARKYETNLLERSLQF